ncbi:MAG: YfhO family protein [Deltaproteobacteria bacterium]|nr:YfhO family protein [Deltaproteobacteria bacterium]
MKTPLMDRAPHELRALFLYIILACFFYPQIVFAGKSLIPTLFQPHGILADGAYLQQGRRPAPTFNVDIATPAYYEFPVNKLAGDLYRRGELPLWNPYQAAGAPLAAQYSTRVFFPYQIAEDISPYWLWDYFMLGRLVIAGFFTYLFLKDIGAGFVPAFAAGALYMFSGAFTWFINLEQMANTAMVVPLFMLSVERIAKASARPPGPPLAQGGGAGRAVALSAVSTGLLFLAGQPEVALYATLLAAAFLCFRTATPPYPPLDKGGIRGGAALSRALFLFAVSYLAGLAIAAPMLLPFLELTGLSFHIHPAGSVLGREIIADPMALFALLTPSITEFPANPEMIRGVSLLAEHKGAFYRFLPVNGMWDVLGSYIGGAALFAALCGVLSAFVLKTSRRRGVFFFFIVFSVSLLLKNAGVRPFVWLGSLPLFDRTWSLRWSSPAWTFAAAAALGLAIEAVAELSASNAALKSRGASGVVDGLRSSSISPYMPAVAAASFLIGVYLIWHFVPAVSITLNRFQVFNKAMAPYAVPSILSGSVVTLISIFLCFYICQRHIVSGTPLWPAVPVILIELWWAVPRGYGHSWLMYKWLPFAVGIITVILVMAEMRIPAFAGAAVFIISALVIDSLSLQGLPPRHDPFREAPYISFIKSRAGHGRVMGGYGALFPNFAGAVGLADVRYVNSLVPLQYHSFRSGFLHAEPYEEWPLIALWFTGSPESARAVRGLGPVPAGITPGPSYALSIRPVEADIEKRLKNYSLLGVKYFIMPPSPSHLPAGERIKPALAGPAPAVVSAGSKLGVRGLAGLELIYDKEVRIYENTNALSRAYMAFDFEYASSFEEAQTMAASLTEPDKAVLESRVPMEGSGGPAAYAAEIKEYSANRVLVSVTAEKDGLLILSDVHYPGWSAAVNGEDAPILRVNGLVRGVPVRKGVSEVLFLYRPASFRAGVAASFAALSLCAYIYFFAGKTKERQYGRRLDR